MVKDQAFCCAGCSTAFQLIHELGLDDRTGVAVDLAGIRSGDTLSESNPTRNCGDGCSGRSTVSLTGSLSYGLQVPFLNHPPAQA